MIVPAGPNDIPVEGANGARRDPSSLEFNLYAHTSFGSIPLPHNHPPDQHSHSIDTAVLQASPDSQGSGAANDPTHPLHATLAALSSLSSQPTLFPSIASPSAGGTVKPSSSTPTVPTHHDGLAPMNVIGQEGSRRAVEPNDSAKSPSSSGGSGEVIGIANEQYFQPGSFSSSATFPQPMLMF